MDLFSQAVKIWQRSFLQPWLTCSKTDDNSIEELFKILFEDITVDGVDKLNPDVVFAGHLLEMIKLAGKVLEVNYGCFSHKTV